MTMRARPGENPYTIPVSAYITLEDWEQVQDWREDFCTSYSDIIRKCVHIGLKHKNELFEILSADQKERRNRYGA